MEGECGDYIMDVEFPVEVGLEVFRSNQRVENVGR
jgi:hypothetical protein